MQDANPWFGLAALIINVVLAPIVVAIIQNIKAKATANTQSIQTVSNTVQAVAARQDAAAYNHIANRDAIDVVCQDVAAVKTAIADTQYQVKLLAPPPSN